MGVRLLYAAAGEGKTRLADRFAELSTADGWQVSEALAECGAVAEVRRTNGHLVIVDRADRWRLDDLLDLICDARLHAPAATRFLLLSRSAGGWWRTVAAHVERTAGLRPSSARLGPLATDDAERELLFLQAFSQFADALAAPQPDGGIRIPNGLDGLDSVLDIHRAALSVVDPGWKAEPEDVNFADVVDAAARSPEIARSELLPQLGADAVLAATGATLVTLAGIPAVSVEMLQSFDELLAATPGIDIEAGSAQIARRLIGDQLRRTRAVADRAALYDRLGGRLLHPGHQQDALDAYAHAVDLRRTLVRRDATTVRRSELALSLGRLGSAQAQVRRWPDALKTLQEALRMWIQLRREGYFAFDLAVARCYGTLATVLDGLGSEREAFAARQYATRIFRTLTAKAVIGEDRLAASVSDLARRYLARGSYLDAAFRAAEAVPLWRRLYASDPSHGPAYADVLLLRGRALWQAGRLEEAESELQQAVAAYRELGEHRIQLISPLAESLTLLAHVRRATEPAAALPLYEEVIGLRRRLVAFDAARWPDLAAAFVAFAWACRDSRTRLGDGFTAVIEACMHYHGHGESGYREELREARALGVQLLEMLGRGAEAGRIRELIEPGRRATDREIFAMVLNRELATAALALNAMEHGRAVELVLRCGPMAAYGLRSEGLGDEILEAARQRDPVSFAELARLTRRTRR